MAAFHPERLSAVLRANRSPAQLSAPRDRRSAERDQQQNRARRAEIAPIIV
jgi:hypothetical protein